MPEIRTKNNEHQALAWRLREALVNPRCGFVPRIALSSADADEPALVGTMAAVGNSSGLRGTFTSGNQTRHAVHGSGIGFTEDEATVPALAEAVERHAMSTFYEEQFAWFAANAAEGRVLDLDTVPRCSEREMEDPHCSLTRPVKDKPIRWVQGLCLHTGEVVSIPAVMVYSHAGWRGPQERFWLPISTGCAAHGSYEQAFLTGICEVVERDALSLIWLQQLALPRIVVDSVNPIAAPYWELCLKGSGRIVNPQGDIMKRPTLVLILLALSFDNTGYVGAQATPAHSSKSTTLTERNTQTFNIPPFSFESAQCLGRNIFFNVTGSAYSTPIILRVSLDGKNSLPFTLPGDLPVNGNRGDWQFAADKQAGVYALFSSPDKHIMIHYSALGDELNRISIQLPKRLYTHSFVVLPSGKAMLVGFISTDETSVEPAAVPVSIWLDSNGNVAKTLQGTTPFVPSEPMDALVVAGVGETFLEASDSKLSIFSSQGELTHTSTFSKPSADAFATGLQLLSGEVAITFSLLSNKGSVLQSATPKTGALEQSWILVDAKSDISSGPYSLPAGFIGSVLCYLGDGRFMGMTREDAHHMFVELGQ